MSHVYESSTWTISDIFRIKIQDVLACSFLDDLLELRDEELSKHMQKTNW